MDITSEHVHKALLWLAETAPMTLVASATVYFAYWIITKVRKDERENDQKIRDDERKHMGD